MRSGSDTKRELGESFRRIIDSASTKEAVHPIKMAHGLLYSAAGGRTPYPDRRSTRLDNGQIAVSPGGAAACILDYERTRQFIRGLNAAITEARKRFRDEVIQVLYAGCGPFAPLAISQCWKFFPDEVQFTLLDIHETSVDIARAIVQSLGLERQFPRIIKTDALKYHPDIRPHVVVTETMMPALMYEPQAAMTAHFSPQMRHRGIFVPEEVALDAYTEEPPESGCLEGEKHPLGPVFRLTKDTPMDARVNADLILPAPKSKKGFENLLISTRVRVFGSIAVEPGTAEITKPFFVTSFREEDEDSRVTLEYAPGDGFLKCVMQDEGPGKKTSLVFPATKSEFSEGQLSFKPSVSVIPD